MSFKIIFSPEAWDHLSDLTARNRRIILDYISVQLTHEPSTPTRHRKQPHPNSLAGWELRIRGHRVFCDIDPDESLVAIIAVGVKRHDKLLIAGEEIEL